MSTEEDFDRYAADLFGGGAPGVGERKKSAPEGPGGTQGAISEQGFPYTPYQPPPAIEPGSFEEYASELFKTPDEMIPKAPKPISPAVPRSLIGNVATVAGRSVLGVVEDALRTTQTYASKVGIGEPWKDKNLNAIERAIKGIEAVRESGTAAGIPMYASRELESTAGKMISGGVESFVRSQVPSTLAYLISRRIPGAQGAGKTARGIRAGTAAAGGALHLSASAYDQAIEEGMAKGLEYGDAKTRAAMVFLSEFGTEALSDLVAWGAFDGVINKTAVRKLRDWADNRGTKQLVGRLIKQAPEETIDGLSFADFFKRNATSKILDAAQTMGAEVATETLNAKIQSAVDKWYGFDSKADYGEVMGSTAVASLLFAGLNLAVGRANAKRIREALSNSAADPRERIGAMQELTSVLRRENPNAASVLEAEWQNRINRGESINLNLRGQEGTVEGSVRVQTPTQLIQRTGERLKEYEETKRRAASGEDVVGKQLEGFELSGDDQVDVRRALLQGGMPAEVATKVEVDSEPSDFQKKEGQRLQEETGRRAIFVKGLPATVRGFNLGRDTVVLNTATKEAAGKALGHEAAHGAEQDTEVDLGSFYKAIFENVGSQDYLEEAHRRALNEEALGRSAPERPVAWSEYTGDIIGEVIHSYRGGTPEEKRKNLTDTFRSLATNRPSAWDRLKRTIGRFTGSIGVESPATDTPEAYARVAEAGIELLGQMKRAADARGFSSQRQGYAELKQDLAAQAEQMPTRVAKFPGAPAAQDYSQARVVAQREREELAAQRAQARPAETPQGRREAGLQVLRGIREGGRPRVGFEEVQKHLVRRRGITELRAGLEEERLGMRPEEPGRSLIRRRAGVAAQPRFLFGGQNAKDFEKTGRKWSGVFDRRQRFEIDDSKMHFQVKPGARVVYLDKTDPNTFYQRGIPPAHIPSDRHGYLAGPLGQIIKHPDLFRNYPQLRMLPVSIEIKPGADIEGIAKNREVFLAPGQMTSDGVDVVAPTMEDALSALTHELQHTISAYEGFTRGSSPGLMRDIRLGTRAPEETIIPGWEENFKYGLWTPANAPTNLGPIESAMVDYSNYQRTVGEMEAENAAVRRTYTPEMRRAYPPYAGMETHAQREAPIPLMPKDMQRRVERGRPMYEAQVEINKGAVVLTNPGTGAKTRFSIADYELWRTRIDESTLTRRQKKLLKEMDLLRFMAKGRLEQEGLLGLIPSGDLARGVRTGAVRSNSDVYIWSFDATGSCVLRIPAARYLNAAVDKLARMGEDAGLNPQEREVLLARIVRAGVPRPCILCYVESRRALRQKYAGIYARFYSGEPISEEDRTKGMESKEQRKQARAFQRQYPGLKSTDIDQELFLDKERLDAAIADPTTHAGQHRDLYWEIHKQTIQNANEVFGSVSYTGGYSRASDIQVMRQRLHGGFRFFSISDFLFEHAVDLMQAIWDIAQRGGVAHLYTKQPATVELLRNTGIKMNLSLNPVTREDGTFGEWVGQSYPWELAKAQRAANPDIGITMMAYNDEQIEWAMKQNWIDYILPYHESGLKAAGIHDTMASGTQKWQDYTQEQKLKIVDEDKYQRYVEEFQARYPGEDPSKGRWRIGWFLDGRAMSDEEIARRALADAEKYGFQLPFHRFMTDENGNIRPRAAKLLKDYGRTDTPQRRLTPNFSRSSFERLMADFVSQNRAEAPVDQHVVAAAIDDVMKFRQRGRQPQDFAHVMEEQVYFASHPIEARQELPEREPRWSIASPGPVWYSRLERFAEQLPGNQAKLDTLQAKLRSGIVDPDEVKWSGLNEWIAEKRKEGGTVAKQELLDFLRENAVKVEEKVLGQSQDPYADQKAKIALDLANDYAITIKENEPEDPVTFHYKDWDSEYRYGDRDFEVGVGTPIEEIVAALPKGMSEEEKKEAADLIIQFVAMASPESTSDETQFDPQKWPSANLPGGKQGTYRELLLTLPEKSLPPELAERWPTEHQGGARFQGQTNDRGQLVVVDMANNGRTVEGPFPSWQVTLARAREYNAQSAEYLPRMRPQTNFTKGHYGEKGYPNVIAHIRFDEREVDGKRILFLQEMQSDWASEGRKQGFGKTELTNEERGRLESLTQYIYQGTDALSKLASKASVLAFQKSKDPYNAELTAAINANMARIDELTAERERFKEELSKLLAKIKEGPPPAPYVEDTAKWTALAVRRMVRWAAENGYDSVAWTPGVMQVERWESALRQKVDEIRWAPDKSPGGAPVVAVEAWKDGKYLSTFSVRNGGRGSVVGQPEGTTLEGLVGKSIAKQIMAEPSGKIEGDDLTIGGEGFKSLYDGYIKQAFEKIGKQFGANVEKAPIGTLVPRDMATPSEQRLDELLGEGVPGQVPVWQLPITEPMRESVVSQGFPRFSISSPYSERAVKAAEKFSEGGKVRRVLNFLTTTLPEAGVFYEDRMRGTRPWIRQRVSPKMEELFQRTQKAWANAGRYIGEWGDPLVLADRQLSREDRRWLKENADLLMEEKVRPPNRRLAVFFEAARQMTDAVAESSIRNGVEVWNPRHHQTTDSEGNQIWVGAWEPFAKRKQYFPRVLTEDTRQALEEQRGPFFEALKKQAHLEGWDFELALSLVNRAMQVMRQGSLENVRLMNLPRTVTVNGKPRKVFRTDADVLYNHLDTSARRLATIEQFGQGSQLETFEAAVTEANALGEMIPAEARDLAVNVWRKMQGSRSELTSEFSKGLLSRRPVRVAWDVVQDLTTGLLSLATIGNFLTGSAPLGSRAGVWRANREFIKALFSSEKAPRYADVRRLSAIASNLRSQLSTTEFTGQGLVGDIVLKGTGFVKVNRAINVASAVIGKQMLDEQVAELRKAGPKSEQYRRYLVQESGFGEDDVDRMVLGEVTQEDYARAISRLIEQVNVTRTSPTSQTALTARPWFRFMFAFSSWVRQMSRNYRWATREFVRGNIRPLLTLLPHMILGEAAVEWVRNLLKDREDETEEGKTEWILSKLINTGLMGVASSITYAMRHFGDNAAPDDPGDALRVFARDTLEPPQAEVIANLGSAVFRAGIEVGRSARGEPASAYKPMQSLGRALPIAGAAYATATRGDTDTQLKRLVGKVYLSDEERLLEPIPGKFQQPKQVKKLVKRLRERMSDEEIVEGVKRVRDERRKPRE